MQQISVRTPEETVRTALQMAKDGIAPPDLLEQAIAFFESLLDEWRRQE